MEIFKLGYVKRQKNEYNIYLWMEILEPSQVIRQKVSALYIFAFSTPLVVLLSPTKYLLMNPNLLLSFFSLTYF